MQKQIWAAPERNKDAILAVLKRVLPPRGELLEIASGTGQHAAHFALNLPDLAFTPSESDPALLDSIHAFRAEAQLPNLREPRALDVRGEDWGVGLVDAVFNANMVHITPWDCTEALVRGVGRHLVDGGVCVLYGPFRLDGAHTAPSNAAFDADLKARDPRWGVRDAEAIMALASAAGLDFTERVAMPANNQCLVFRRRARVTESRNM